MFVSIYSYSAGITLFASDLVMDNGIKPNRRKDRFKDPGDLPAGRLDLKDRFKDPVDLSAGRLDFREPGVEPFNYDTQDGRKVDNVAEELKELLLRETITRDEYKTLKVSNELTSFNSVCCTDLKQNGCLPTSNVKHLSLAPYPYNDSGIPVNWTETKSCTTNSIYQLITLSAGDEEYDSIHNEMENSGIDVTKIERLENIYLLSRFKSETEDIQRHRPEGTSKNHVHCI